MRRIYDSEALRRDDGPFSPNERESDEQPQAMQSIPSTKLSNSLVPLWLRFRAISVEVSTPHSEYPVDAGVPFSITMKNSMPFPITIPTSSPLLWTWDVDDVQEASHVQLRDPPAEERGFRFDRGERKRFTRRWQQKFRVSNSEWESAALGKYTIGAGINIENADKKGLYDETTIRIVQE